MLTSFSVTGAFQRHVIATCCLLQPSYLYVSSMKKIHQEDPKRKHVQYVNVLHHSEWIILQSGAWMCVSHSYILYGDAAADEVARDCGAYMKLVWIMTNGNVTIRLAHVAATHTHTQTHCITCTLKMDVPLTRLYISDSQQKKDNCGRNQFIWPTTNNYFSLSINHLIIFLIDYEHISLPRKCLVLSDQQSKMQRFSLFCQKVQEIQKLLTF